MSIDQLLLLLVIAVIANVALMGALIVPPFFGRRALFMPGEEDAETPSSVDVALQMAAAQVDAPPEARAGLTGAAFDKVVRIVAYAFLVVAAALVAVTQEWSRSAPLIYVLLAVAALFVLSVHDLLPSSVLGPGKFVLEGSAAIAFFTVLIALTGGVDSPFFFGYYLIVAGGALVVAGAANYVLAAVISLVYLLTIAGLPGAQSLEPPQLLRMAFSLVGLWLLSYLASVIAGEQRHTRDAALRLSLYDPLTRLYNRSYFYAVLEREIQRASRTRRGFCLLMIDLDGLKQINDTEGHHAGDRVLREVSLVLRRGIRSIDAGARLGGDEFMIILPETELSGAVVLAEKLRTGVAALRVDVDGTTIRPSISVGVVSYPEDGDTGDQLLVRADEAMYISKRGGRDRVIALRQPEPPR
ncbi:MAG: GGDEF domain-containing protein, partial [Chloroflexota bacterium]